MGSEPIQGEQKASSQKTIDRSLELDSSLSSTSGLLIEDHLTPEKGSEILARNVDHVWKASKRLLLVHAQVQALVGDPFQLAMYKDASIYLNRERSQKRFYQLIREFCDSDRAKEYGINVKRVKQGLQLSNCSVSIWFRGFNSKSVLPNSLKYNCLSIRDDYGFFSAYCQLTGMIPVL